MYSSRIPKLILSSKAKVLICAKKIEFPKGGMWELISGLWLLVLQGRKEVLKGPRFLSLG